MYESGNALLVGMTGVIKIKFKKYWGDVTKINILLYVVIILDPQFKLCGLIYRLNLANGRDQVDSITLRLKKPLMRCL